MLKCYIDLVDFYIYWYIISYFTIYFIVKTNDILTEIIDFNFAVTWKSIIWFFLQ